MKKQEISLFKKRLENFRRKMRKIDLEAAVITKRESYIYLSGFTGTDAQLFITQSEALLLTDFRYTEQAVKQAPDYEIVQCIGRMLDTLSMIVEEKKIGVLGFEETHMSYDQYKNYKEKLKVGEFKGFKGIIEDLRVVKDRDETATIKKAVEIADRAFSHILDYIKPGVREIEIAAELEYYMKKEGAGGPSFDTIVASGARSAMPHGVASEKKIELGDAVTLDYGCIYHHYCSDMTRTVFVGTPAPELEKIYKIVLKAQSEALAGARKGLTGVEVDGIARKIIAEASYDSYFGHGLGHGVGLEIHENPRLSPLGKMRMKNGMVATVEPGIYISGLGGVRIEDMIVIHDDHPDVLTSSTKNMLIL